MSDLFERLVLLWVWWKLEILSLEWESNLSFWANVLPLHHVRLPWCHHCAHAYLSMQLLASGASVYYYSMIYLKFKLLNNVGAYIEMFDAGVIYMKYFNDEVAKWGKPPLPMWQVVGSNLVRPIVYKFTLLVHGITKIVQRPVERRRLIKYVRFLNISPTNHPPTWIKESNQSKQT